MAIGKMSSEIKIKSHTETFDSEGFSTVAYTELLSCRAAKEERSGGESWVNDSRFANVSCVFTFRVADIAISPAMIIEDGSDVWEIVDIQRTRGNGLWLQAYCKKVEASG